MRESSPQVAFDVDIRRVLRPDRLPASYIRIRKSKDTTHRRDNISRQDFRWMCGVSREKVSRGGLSWC
jgi:hypothetical protein